MPLDRTLAPVPLHNAPIPIAWMSPEDVAPDGGWVPPVAITPGEIKIAMFDDLLEWLGHDDRRVVAAVARAIADGPFMLHRSAAAHALVRRALDEADAAGWWWSPLLDIASTFAPDLKSMVDSARFAHRDALLKLWLLEAPADAVRAFARFPSLHARDLVARCARTIPRDVLQSLWPLHETTVVANPYLDADTASAVWDILVDAAETPVRHTNGHRAFTLFPGNMHVAAFFERYPHLDRSFFRRLEAWSAEDWTILPRHTGAPLNETELTMLSMRADTVLSSPDCPTDPQWLLHQATANPHARLLSHPSMPPDGVLALLESLQPSLNTLLTISNRNHGAIASPRVREQVLRTRSLSALFVWYDHMVTLLAMPSPPCAVDRGALCRDIHRTVARIVTLFNAAARKADERAPVADVIRVLRGTPRAARAILGAEVLAPLASAEDPEVRTAVLALLTAWDRRIPAAVRQDTDGSVSASTRLTPTRTR